MSDSFQIIVDRDASLAEAETASRGLRAWLIETEVVADRRTDCVLGGDGQGYPPGGRFHLACKPPFYSFPNFRTNGCHVLVERQLYCAPDYYVLTCPRCGKLTAWEDFGDALLGAISEWYEQSGADKLSCPECRRAQPVSEWTFEPPVGFGNLGVQFWNWPPLKDSFVDEVSKALGHRTILVSGKL